MDQNRNIDAISAGEVEAGTSRPVEHIEAHRSPIARETSIPGNHMGVEKGPNYAEDSARDTAIPSAAPLQAPERCSSGGSPERLSQRDEPLSGSSSLFSVPSAHNPTSGVYSMPEEAFQFKDLDSGRVFYMDKRYWIKDVDTGKVYVMEPDGSNPAGTTRASSPEQLGNVRVSDLLSGRDLSLQEFEEAMGYFRDPPPLPLPSPGAAPQQSSSPDMVAVAQQFAQRGMHSLTIGK